MVEVEDRLEGVHNLEDRLLGVDEADEDGVEHLDVEVVVVRVAMGVGGAEV